jgi:hypothetical protein
LKSQLARVTGILFILTLISLGTIGCSKSKPFSKSFLDSPEETIQKTMLEKLPIETGKDQVLKYIYNQKLQAVPIMLGLNDGQQIGKSDFAVELGYCSHSIWCDCVVVAQFYFDSDDKLIRIYIFKGRGCV